jgi:DnaJ-domain-containing protein 1
MILGRFAKILKASMAISFGEQKNYKINHSFDPDNSQAMNSDPYKEASYYANLELKTGAGFAEIKASYKELIKKYHPDKFNQNEEQRKIAEEITRKLNEAYIYFERKFNKEIK